MKRRLPVFLSSLFLFVLLTLPVVKAWAADTLFFYVSPASKVYYTDQSYTLQPLGEKTALDVVIDWQKWRKVFVVKLKAHKAADYLYVSRVVEDVQNSGQRPFVADELTDAEARQMFPTDFAEFEKKRKEIERMTQKVADNFEVRASQPARLEEKKDTEALTLIFYPNNKLIWYESEKYPNLRVVNFSVEKLEEILKEAGRERLLLKIHEQASPATMKTVFNYLDAKEITNFDFEPIELREKDIIAQLLKN